MEKTFNITLKDVARFLKSLSYDWNGEIILVVLIIGQFPSI